MTYRVAPLLKTGENGKKMVGSLSFLDLGYLSRPTSHIVPGGLWALSQQAIPRPALSWDNSITGNIIQLARPPSPATVSPPPTDHGLKA